jgi:flagellar hook-length control protein FliK
MSLILPSSGAPRPSANPTPNASNGPVRGDAPAEDGAGSFGAALSRSLEPAGKIADKDGEKAAPAKRQADKAKTGVEDLINAMALGLVPLESRIVKAVPNGGAAAATVTTAALTATAGATTADAAARANTLAASAAATLAGESTAAPDGPATAAALNTDTARQSTLAPALAAPLTPAASATGAKTTGPSALTAVADSATLALTPGVVAGQNAAPESGLGGQSEKRDSQGAMALTGMRAVKDASVDLSAVQARGATKIPADLSAPASDSAAISVVSSQAPDEATASADVALPGAALLAPPPGAAALANAAAPEATSTASLAPDVGSSEWGKALGQQIVHMGKAGQPLAELQLNPPGLGPLKVTLSMNDQQMQASFVSAHASVRVAIEAALPQLRSTLADSGISLGNTSVSSDSQQQAFADRPGGQASPRSYRNSSVPDAPALAARLVAAPRPDRIGRGGSSVDIYA